MHACIEDDPGNSMSGNTQERKKGRTWQGVTVFWVPTCRSAWLSWIFLPKEERKKDVEDWMDDMYTLRLLKACTRLHRCIVYRCTRHSCIRRRCATHKCMRRRCTPQTCIRCRCTTHKCTMTQMHTTQMHTIYHEMSEQGIQHLLGATKRAFSAR